MKLTVFLLALLVGLAGIITGCNPSKTSPAPGAGSDANTPVVSKNAAPLPDSGFKAEITISDPPTKLRTGQVETITFRVKNASNVTWWQRGGEINERSDNNFYIAAGNRWLDKDGKPTSEPEGHNGIPKDLKPGEDAEMTLQITAPKQAGEYIMNLDMVQEGVSWFAGKGSTPTKVKVVVVR